VQTRNRRLLRHRFGDIQQPVVVLQSSFDSSPIAVSGIDQLQNQRCNVPDSHLRDPLILPKLDSFPITYLMCTMLWKASVAGASLIIGRPFHALFTPDLRSHSHLHKANQCNLRSPTPKPPGLAYIIPGN
jgi:hypothetical protein